MGFEDILFGSVIAIVTGAVTGAVSDHYIKDPIRKRLSKLRVKKKVVKDV